MKARKESHARNDNGAAEILKAFDARARFAEDIHEIMRRRSLM